MNRPPRPSGEKPVGSSTSRFSAWAGWVRPGPSTTFATSKASPAGLAPCPNSGWAKPTAFTWPRWPTASTPPISSPPRAGSWTITWSPRWSSPRPVCSPFPRGRAWASRSTRPRSAATRSASWISPRERPADDDPRDLLMNVSPTRRQFLQGASGAILAAATPAAAADPAPPPIIDTHVHLWNLSQFRLAWLEATSQLHRDFKVDDYRRASEGLNIVKAIYMEVDVDPNQQEQEARAVADLCRRGQSVLAAAVISGRPASDRFAGTSSLSPEGL